MPKICTLVCVVVLLKQQIILSSSRFVCCDFNLTINCAAHNYTKMLHELSSAACFNSVIFELLLSNSEFLSNKQTQTLFGHKHAVIHIHL